MEPWSPPNDSVELVAAGCSWDAVRAQSSIGARVLERLGEDSGAVIADGSAAILYWLVHPGAADAWELPQPFVEIRGVASYIAVPPVTYTDGSGLRWATPLAPTRYLTDPELLHAALAAEVNAAIGPRPVEGASAMTGLPAPPGNAALLPCEPCLTARVFGGRHDCSGTAQLRVIGQGAPLVQPGPCPCDHQPSQARPGKRP